MNTRILCVWIALLTCQIAGAQTKSVAWGDQGSGTYINLILSADYSDPDVIKVGGKYYTVNSDFHYMGMPVLESDDMTGWEIISQVHRRLDFPDWGMNGNYGEGLWAPSIRHHDGKFWIYFCTPRERLMINTTTDPHGPWSPLHCVRRIGGWEDPCPIWDDNDQTYLGRNQLGTGPIILYKVSADGRTLKGDEHVIHTGPVAEGTEFHRRDGYYYISIPKGGVGEEQQTILRSKDICGPYERKVVLEKGSTNVNGPHQGALVDTPEGEWWFYYFQSTEPLGRVVHLQPAHQKDGWSVTGVDIDMNGMGEPVRVWTKPNTGRKVPVGFPQGGGPFDSSELNLQWQFNHNPSDADWNLVERKGWLLLKALKADHLQASRNMLTQECIGYKGTVTTEMDMSSWTEGQYAGLFYIGNLFNGTRTLRKNGKNYLYLENNGGVEKVKPVSGKKIYFRATMNTRTNQHQLYYSTDNENFTPCREAYSLKFSGWKGIRVGPYSYNMLRDGGNAFFNWFIYDFN